MAATRALCPRDGAVIERPPVPMAPPAEGPTFSAPGFSIKRCIGVGGFGEVFLAQRVDDGGFAAIKVAHREPREAAERLALEIDALVAIGPPAVPAVFERGFSDGVSYFAMEHLQGCTLADLLEEKAGPFDEATFESLATSLLSSLEAVHRAGFVHGDLKPENIFLENRTAARLIDFGTVQRISGGALLEDSVQTPTNQAVGPGTAEYMSPEQCVGSPLLDGRSDIYALGAIFCEMLTGAPPFWGRAAEVREAQKSRRPGLLAQVPPALSQMVLKCLAKRPNQRFPDVAALREALLAVEAEPSSATRPEARPASSELDAKTKQKRLLAVVHFSATASDLPAILTRAGGKLAYKSGNQCAAVFGHDVADNPARSAMAAAEMLVNRGMCKTAIVDVALVHVQAGRDGTARYFSPTFGKKDRYPVDTDQSGTLLTAAAAQVLGDIPTVPDRAGLVRVKRVERRDDTMIARPNVLFGRERLVTELLEIAGQTKATARPSAALIVSPAGYGKTHLASELAYQLELSAYSVLWLRPAQDALLGSRATTQQLLRACVVLPEQAPNDGGRELWHSLLGAASAEQTWAAASLTLEWVADDHPEVRKLLAAPGALRSALARITGELLRQKAARHPTAVVIDGAQLADDASLDAIDFAVLAEGSCPLNVVALARPAFQQDRPGWCRGATRFRSFELDPLDDVEAGKLVRRLLEPAETVPTWAVDQLVSRTQGVPGLLVELVRGLKREGLVRKHEGGTAHYVAGEVLARLPDMPILSWSTSREVESLPSELTAHARLASIWGRPFKAEDIEHLIDVIEREGPLEEVVLDAGVGIARLLQAGLLVVRRNASFDFRSVLLRETLYESTPASLRARAHTAAYILNAEMPEPYSIEIMSNLARHAGPSGQSQQATHWYLALGQRALERQVYQEAASMLDAALEHAAGDDAAIEGILYQRGMARFRLGRFADAVADFARAAQLASAGGAPARQTACLLAQAMVTDWMYQLERSSALVEEARRVCPEAPPARLEIEMSVALGRARHRANDHEAALQLLVPAAAKAEALGDEGYEMFVIALLLCGWSYATLGKLDESEATFARAVAAAEARHDQVHLAAVINNRITLWFGRAAITRLLADLQRVRDIARESGFVHMEGHVELNLGETLYCLGELDVAADHARRALEAHARVGASARTTNVPELLLARIGVYSGDLDAARRALEAMELRSRSARERGDGDVDLLVSDQLILASVRLAVSEAVSSAWDQLVADSRVEALAPHERAELWETRALAECRAGHREEGIKALRAADEIARTSAQIIAPRIRARLDALLRDAAAS
jgi:serine/threonine protein kinase/tetratricopeptide (TPR) repeat protein